MITRIRAAATQAAIGIATIALAAIVIVFGVGALVIASIERKVTR